MYICTDCNILQKAWYLYKMVTQNMLHMHEGKKAFSEEKDTILFLI